MSNNPNTIKSPRPRWFNGILYSNSPSPNPDYDSVKGPSIVQFPLDPGADVRRTIASGDDAGDTTKSCRRASEETSFIAKSPSMIKPSITYDRSKKDDNNFLREIRTQFDNMSPFSDISADIETEHDVQSIQFDDVISYLQDVKLCDTAMFTPNIQY